MSGFLMYSSTVRCRTRFRCTTGSSVCRAATIPDMGLPCPWRQHERDVLLMNLQQCLVLVHQAPVRVVFRVFLTNVSCNCCKTTILWHLCRRRTPNISPTGSGRCCVDNAGIGFLAWILPIRWFGLWAFSVLHNSVALRTLFLPKSYSSV